jgi:hypothetical protein
MDCPRIEPGFHGRRPEPTIWGMAQPAWNNKIHIMAILYIR